MIRQEPGADLPRDKSGILSIKSARSSIDFAALRVPTYFYSK